MSGPLSAAALDAARQELLQQEMEFCATLPTLQQPSFLAGRLAVRRALLAQQHRYSGCSGDGGGEALAAAAAALRAGPILKAEGGGPLLPSCVVGSISHKARIAVAVVSTCCDGTIGIDIEDVGGGAARRRRRHSRTDADASELCAVGSTTNLGLRILTAAERESICGSGDGDGGGGGSGSGGSGGGGDGSGESALGLTAEQQVLLRFSVKESLYKALSPRVRRYVGFREAEVGAVHLRTVIG
ncbi:hypothetical protein JKP88DRAFT_348670 [Tribonema minus]|uniref:4'-phosphopantetheinyl transferase n=1 Tax=Tribonema minus TaxID=303371 RepID=A0A835Z1R2_9STRA|nr:hypothetical protein JKP88DRAFT_348670 [Tribonema minus]